MAYVMLDVLGLVQRTLAEPEECTSDSRDVRAAVLRTSADKLQVLLDSCRALLDSIKIQQNQASSQSGRDDDLSVSDSARMTRDVFGAYYRIRGSCITLRTILNEEGSRDISTEELQSYTSDVDLEPALIMLYPGLFLSAEALGDSPDVLLQSQAFREFNWPRIKAFSALIRRLENTRIELVRAEPELRAKAARIEAGLIRR